MISKKLVALLVGCVPSVVAQEPCVWLNISIPVRIERAAIDSVVGDVLLDLDKCGLEFEKEKKFFIDLASLHNVPVSKIDQIMKMVSNVLKNVKNEITLSSHLYLTGHKLDNVVAQVRVNSSFSAALTTLGNLLKQNGIQAKIFSKKPFVVVGKIAIKDFSRMDIVSLPAVYKSLKRKLAKTFMGKSIAMVSSEVVVNQPHIRKRTELMRFSLDTTA